MIRIIKYDNWLLLYAPKQTKFDMLIEQLLVCCHVREKSFAYESLYKLFACLFLTVTNLSDEYSKYHNVEYSSFRDYLYEKEMYSKSEVGFLLQELPDQHDLYTISPSLYSYNYKTYFEDEPRVIEGVNKLLKEVSAQ